MMKWRDALLAHAAAHSLYTTESDLGIGVDFRDGYDTLWLFPGDVLSTVPVETTTPSDEVISTFEAICGLRAQFLHVLNHHIAREQLERYSADGYEQNFTTWYSNPERPDQSGELRIGQRLTAMLVRHRAIAPIMQEWADEGNFFSSDQVARIDEYLALPAVAEPALARRSPLLDRKIRLYRRERLGRSMSPLRPACERRKILDAFNSLRNRPACGEPIEQLIRALDQLLPKAHAEEEPGAIRIGYEDAYGEYRIDITSSDLADRVDAVGAFAEANRIVEEYGRISSRRSRVIRAVMQAARSLDWLVDEGEIFEYGITSARVRLDIGDPLTQRVQTEEPATTLRRLFADDAEFLGACLKALGAPEPVRRLGVRQTAFRDLPTYVCRSLTRRVSDGWTR